jgi:hypothetical protein
LSAFASAIGGLAAAPAVLSARQLMTRNGPREIFSNGLKPYFVTIGGGVVGAFAARRNRERDPCIPARRPIISVEFRISLEIQIALHSFDREQEPNLRANAQNLNSTILSGQVSGSIQIWPYPRNPVSCCPNDAVTENVSRKN